MVVSKTPLRPIRSTRDGVNWLKGMNVCSMMGNLLKITKPPVVSNEARGALRVCSNPPDALYLSQPKRSYNNLRWCTSKDSCRQMISASSLCRYSAICRIRCCRFLTNQYGKSQMLKLTIFNCDEIVCCDGPV